MQPTPSRGCTAYLSDPECTPLELSNDVDFVDMIVKTTENSFQHSLPPYIMHVSHMIRVQPPLVVYGVIR